MSHRSRVWLTAVVATLTIGTAGALAAGDTEKVKTKVGVQSAKLGTAAVKGKIKSDEKACVKKRKVKLLEHTDYGIEKVASAKANKKGVYTLKTKQLFEIWQYQVVAAKKKVSDNLECKPGKSQLVSAK